MKKTTFTFNVLILLTIFIACNNSKKNDLGIVDGKIETYFYQDTSYSDEKITVYPKFNRDSLYFKPYNIGFEYSKEYDEKEASWKLNFSVAQSNKYVSVF